MADFLKFESFITEYSSRGGTEFKIKGDYAEVEIGDEDPKQMLNWVNSRIIDSKLKLKGKVDEKKGILYIPTLALITYAMNNIF